MNLIAFILACVAIHGQAESSVRLTDLSSEYCPEVDSIKMTLKNTGQLDLLCSVLIELEDDGGEWREYCSDVLGKERYPRKVTALRLAAGESRAIPWRPRQTGSTYPLAEGHYRVVVIILTEGHLPAEKVVAARFVVAERACQN